MFWVCSSCVCCSSCIMMSLCICFCYEWKVMKLNVRGQFEVKNLFFCARGARPCTWYQFLGFTNTRLVGSCIVVICITHPYMVLVVVSIVVNRFMHIMHGHTHVWHIIVTPASCVFQFWPQTCCIYLNVSLMGFALLLRVGWHQDHIWSLA